MNELLQKKIDLKTKPPGSLGKLETLALQIGGIQNTLEPELRDPTIVIFAADHGIASDGEVNPYPQEVTWQMVCNFLAGGAAINVFARQHGMAVKVVDAGVKHEFEAHPDLIDAKIDQGTKSYLHEPAMSEAQCLEAIERGGEVIRNLHAGGCNVVGFGEMGIGNTSSASLIMCAVMNLPIEDCVGSGTGLDSAGVQKKAEVLGRVIKKHQLTSDDPMKVLQTYGGFEIAMIYGALIQAADLKMLILNDGFIVTAALLVAAATNPKVLDYCVFSHASNEQGHQKMLSYLKADPLLNLGLRLGEGTGAAMAYPIVEGAVNFLNQMTSFEDAGVSQ